MFGYVVPNQSLLSDADKQRFRAAYCGLCRTLRKRHGLIGSATLSYDLTFLALLLGALYEPEESAGEERCITRPVKKHLFAFSAPYEYAADMNVLLAYHKRMDDWLDDRDLAARSQAGLLKRAYERASEQYPTQSQAIENWLKGVHEIEKRTDRCIDLPANATGRMLGRIFAARDDFWSENLNQIGDGLGRFIYLMDAYDDLPTDLRRNRFNPLKPYREDADFEKMCYDAMKMAVADSAEAFERLPILKDVNLLRNILYSGVWSRYAAIQNKRNPEKKGAK